MNKRAVWKYVFTFPCLFALTFTIIVPFIIGFYYSFTNWDGINAPEIIGLKNFYRVFNDGLFWQSIIFTVKFAVANLILTNFLGLFFALLVTRKIAGKNLFRTFFFMPNLIGGLILGFIWQFIFIDGFARIASITGLKFLNGWLSTTNTGFWGLVIIVVWQMAGYTMVIYIAYLENISVEMIESANIDGANGFQKLIYMIIPLIAPAFTVSLFLTLSSSFKLFDQNLALTNGSPGNTTEMTALNIYKSAFSQNLMGYAQAKAVIFLLIIAAISLFQIYYNKKQEVEI